MHRQEYTAAAAVDAASGGGIVTAAASSSSTTTMTTTKKKIPAARGVRAHGYGGGVEGSWTWDTAAAVGGKPVSLVGSDAPQPEYTYYTHTHTRTPKYLVHLAVSPGSPPPLARQRAHTHRLRRTTLPPVVDATSSPCHPRAPHPPARPTPLLPPRPYGALYRTDTYTYIHLPVVFLSYSFRCRRRHGSFTHGAQRRTVAATRKQHSVSGVRARSVEYLHTHTHLHAHTI